MLLKRLQNLSDLIKNCRCTKKQNIINTEKAIFFVHLLLQKMQQKNAVAYVIGNGGSAGIASHFAVDLIKTLNISAMTLVDSNLMTCISNDYGYEHVYSVPLETLLKKEDLLFAISSSGKSKNILNAVFVAKKKQAKVITLSGFSGYNPLQKTGDLNFFIDKKDYGLVESAHFFLLHTIIDLWKTNLFAKKTLQMLIDEKEGKNISRN